MRGLKFRLTAALAVAAVFAVQPAASQAIGLATAKGSFQVDSARVAGNATLFAGSTLETAAVPSDLRLNSGVRMQLEATSRGRVLADRLVLEKGAGQLEGAGNYGIEARTLRILPAGPDSAARVVLTGENAVEAAALRGSFRVTGAGGRLLANLASGRALMFEPQAQAAGPTPPFTMSGCLERRNGRYVLTDQIAGVTEELVGSNLDREVGNMVEVTATVVAGAKPVAGASEVIQVSRLRRISRNCAVAAPAPAPRTPAPSGPAAQQAPAQPAPPPASAPKAGMSGSTKAVIAGVVVAGAGAGVYFGVVRKEEKGTVSR